MEALVPAFLLALLCQLSDRPAMLAARLADRFDRPLTVVLAALAAFAALHSAAALAAMAIAPMLTPEARQLLLAVALLSGAAGAFGRRKLPGWTERGMAALPTALAGIVAVSLGDRAQFFTFALATGGQPWLAAAGAILASTAIAFIAATLGVATWRHAGAAWLRIAAAAVMLVAGAVVGLGALRLL